MYSEETIVNDQMPKLTAQQRWSIASDFIRKSDAAELVAIKTVLSQGCDDVSIDSLDEITAMAVNSILNRGATKENVEDVLDMITLRIDNARAVPRRLEKVLTGKQNSRLLQLLMSAANSKEQAKKAFAEVSRQ